MTPQPLRVAHPDGEMRGYRWPNAEAPPLLLVHGTGFCAATFTPAAAHLARRYDVYAVDRRGHGGTRLRGAEPALWTFGEDLAPLLDRRPDAPWTGVGHSAGSTDLLFAAAQAPDRFAALALHEPTVAGATPEAPSPQHIWAELAEKRRGRFTDARDAHDSLRPKPAYADWHEEAFRGYLRDGFRDAPDGGVTLCCPPAREAAYCRTVVRAMHNEADVAAAFRGRLADLPVPVRLLRSEGSPAIFAVMVERLRALVGGPPATVLSGGHCLPMERPAAFAEAATAASVRR